MTFKLKEKLKGCFSYIRDSKVFVQFANEGIYTPKESKITTAACVLLTASVQGSFIRECAEGLPRVCDA